MSAAARPSVVLELTEVVTVGLPFCAFKLLTGLVLREIPLVGALGWALLALGAIDLILNGVGFVSLAVRRRRAFGVCTTDLLVRAMGRGQRRPDVGLALDVLLSFVLVAVMIGFGWLARLPAPLLGVWNVAVIFNVLGAGVGRLWSALRAPR